MRKILVITLILIAGLFLFSASQTSAQPACEINADCDDGLFCTGDEVCAAGSCQAGPPPCPPFSICDEVSSECLCSSDADCDDGLYCNGVETCNRFSGICDITFDFFWDYPCLDCLPNLDDCDCNEVTDSCQPVNLTVGSGSGLPGTIDNPVTVSLDTLFTEVAFIQVDVCDVEDKLTCTGCNIDGRTPSEFSCFAVEQPDGCCRIVLHNLITNAVIDTGTGPVFTVNYEVDMSAPIGECRLLDPQQVAVGSIATTPLDVDATPGDFCFTSPPPDSDDDGIPDDVDNCQFDQNPDQEDTYPPQGNDIGDACDCESDFDCDGDVDGSDAQTFKIYFGRNLLSIPCDTVNPCRGDYDCDQDCDGTDASLFKTDFGRSEFNNPCPACIISEWCVYP